MRPRTLTLLAATMTLAFGADAMALDAPESKLFTARDFKLESGVVLPELTLAYETYGTLAPDGRNAVLHTHGYTGSHHAAGRYGATGAAKGHKAGDVGSWDKLIGPGKAIDTDKLFVVASNMLGSSYGSTNPATIDPKTGKPYGPDFPRHTVGDIVRAQKALLDYLGVKHLIAVVGPSYGGYQAFQWAVTYPDFMRGVVPVVTAPKSTGGADATQKLIAQLAEDPNWNGGWYLRQGRRRRRAHQDARGHPQALRHRGAARGAISRCCAARGGHPRAGGAVGAELRCQRDGGAAPRAREPTTRRPSSERSRPRCSMSSRAPTIYFRPRLRPPTCRRSRPPGSMPATPRSTASSGISPAGSTATSGRRP